LPWLLKLLGNKLLLLRLRLLWLLLSPPSPGCEDQLELLLSNVDLLRGALTLLALRSKLSLLLLLGQQLLLLLLLLGELLLLLLLLDSSVDVELGNTRLPRFGDLVLNEAELLLALVQELLLFRTEFQRLQILKIKAR